MWWRHGSRLQQIRALVVQRMELAEQLCPHRPFVIGELVHALRNEGAVTFADVMIRRLIHVQGPCLRESCLRSAHDWFASERELAVDDDPEVAIAAVRREVRELTGDLSVWREALV